MNNIKEKIYCIGLCIFVIISSIVFTKVTNVNGINILLSVLLIIIILSFIIHSDFLIVISVLLFGFMREFFIYNLRMPRMTSYILDLLIMILLFKIIIRVKNKKNLNKVSLVFFVGFTIIAIFSFITTNSSLNGLKSSFYSDYLRYFIIYISIISLNITDKQVKSIINIFIIFIFLQVPAVLWQIDNVVVRETSKYVIEDYYSGLLGGKATAELGLLITIVIAYYYGLVVTKQKSIIKFLGIVLILLIPVFISEIKVIMVLMPLVIILISLFQLKNLKGIIAMSVIILISIFGMRYLMIMYPKFGELFGNLDNVIAIGTHNYAGSGLSRLDGIPIAISNIRGSLYSLIFGNGPGYGVMSYNGLYQFRIFYFPYLISEYGISGFLILISFYIYHLILSLRLMYSSSKEQKVIGIMGVALVFVVIFSGIYSMGMVKSNFAVPVWILLGIISKVWYEKLFIIRGSNEDDKYNNSSI